MRWWCGGKQQFTLISHDALFLTMLYISPRFISHYTLFLSTLYFSLYFPSHHTWFLLILYFLTVANPDGRITKLMGESFKLHSQALVGYEDAVASGSNATTPTMSSQGVELEMDAAF